MKNLLNKIYKNKLTIGDILITASIVFLFYYYFNINIYYDVVYDSMPPKDLSLGFFFLTPPSDTLGYSVPYINLSRIMIFVLNFIFEDNVFLVFNFLSITSYIFTIIKIFQFYGKNEFLDKIVLSLFLISPISLYFNKILIPFSLFIFSIFLFLKINKNNHKDGLLFAIMSIFISPAIFIINISLYIESQLETQKYKNYILTLIAIIFFISFNFNYLKNISFEGFAYWASKVLSIEINGSLIENVTILLLYFSILIYFCYKNKKVNYSRLTFCILFTSFVCFVFAKGLFIAKDDQYYYGEKSIFYVFWGKIYFLIWHKVSTIILLFYILLLKWSEDKKEKLILIALLLLSIISVDYLSPNKDTRILSLDERQQMFNEFKINRNNMLEIDIVNFYIKNKHEYSLPFFTKNENSEQYDNDVCFIYYKFDEDIEPLMKKVVEIDKNFINHPNYLKDGVKKFNEKLFERSFKYRYFIFNKNLSENCETMITKKGN